MTFRLPSLPYDYAALEPYLSSDTLRFHHDKHHQAYVDTLNKLIAGTKFENRPLEEIIRATAHAEEHRKIFNNAAQVWNHTVQWNCMRAGGGGAPPKEIARQIDKAFGSIDEFKQKFKEAGVNQFGSGWVWLVSEKGKLSIVATPNAMPPFVDGKDVLFTCDVWEHAYYLDFQNRRPDYIATFLDHLVNWDYVGQRMNEPTAALREFAA
jgi:Fe-Mn family superoxide dismutase